jgi:hypothetical protein
MACRLKHIISTSPPPLLLLMLLPPLRLTAPMAYTHPGAGLMPPACCAVSL